MTELGLLKTTDGDVIKVTQDMLEDFHVLSRTYSVSIRKLISDIFDAEWIDNTALMALGAVIEDTEVAVPLVTMV
jgi:hypothetical protein